MTDYLETYRQMVRSMRFVPPLDLSQLSRQSVPEPVLPAPIPGSSQKWRTANLNKPVPTPPIDLSKRAANLIREAVSKPTVLPVTYAILENPGDRISRLSPPKPTPAPQWESTSSHTTPVEAVVPETPISAPTATRQAPDTPLSQKEIESVAPSEPPVARSPDHDVPVPQDEDTPKPEIIEPAPSNLEATPTPPPSPQNRETPEVPTPTQDAETPQPPAPDEPAPVAIETVTPRQQDNETETTSNRATPEVTCPQCQSSDIRKNGHRKDKQRYRCKDCGRNFVLPDVDEVEEKSKRQKDTLSKRASVTPPPAANTSSDRLFNSTKRRSKKKTRAKGFGSSSSKSGD